MKWRQLNFLLLFVIIPFFGVCQIDNEGKIFLTDFFYKLPLRASKIESINILKSQADNFHIINASGALDPNALDANAKAHPFINLNETQKQRPNSLQILQFYDDKTKKSIAKRIILLNEDSYINFNNIVSLLRSIAFSDAEANCKQDETLCKRVRLFFDNKLKEQGGYPFATVQMNQLYSGDSIKEKYQLIITLIEDNLTQPKK